MEIAAPRTVVPRAVATTISTRLNPRTRFLERLLINPSLLVLRNITAQDVSRLRVLRGRVLYGDGHASERGYRVAVCVQQRRDQNRALVVSQRDNLIVRRVIDAICSRVRQLLQLW